MATARQEQYAKLYAELNDYLQEIIQIMALLYLPEKNSETVKFLLACQNRIKPGVTTTYSDVKHALQELRRSNFLHIDPHKRYYLERDFTDYVLINYCRQNARTAFYLQKIDEKFPHERPRFMWLEDGSERRARDFRNALFLPHLGRLELQQQKLSKMEFVISCAKAMRDNFIPELILTQSNPIQYMIVVELCSLRLPACYSIDDILPFLKSRLKEDTRHRYCALYARGLMLTGRVEQLQQLCDKVANFPQRDYYLAVNHFMQGNVARAKDFFERAISHTLKSSRKKIIVPPGEFGLFYCMTFIAAGEILDPYFISMVNHGLKGGECTRVYYGFKALIAHLNGDKVATLKCLTRSFSDRANDPRFSHYEYMFMGFIISVMEFDFTWYQEVISNLYRLLVLGVSEGYLFSGYQASQLLLKLKTQLPEDWQTELNKRSLAPASFAPCREKYIDFANMIAEESEWEKVFKVLRNITGRQTADHVTNQHARLIWLFRYTDYGSCFSPIEQKILKSGKWSKGRPVALKRLKAGNVDSATVLDQEIAASCIREERYGYYGRTEFHFDADKAIPYMAKHPYLFLEESPTTPVEIIEDKLRLEIHKVRDGYSLSFPFPILTRGIKLIQETATRYRFVRLNETHLKIASTFKDKQSFKVPNVAEAELKDIISGLSALMPIHSDIGGGSDNNAESIKVKGNATIHLHLLPLGDGIRAELFVRPFVDAGPYLKPGHGTIHLITEIGNKIHEATRNLKREQHNADTLIAACPSLAIRGATADIFNFAAIDECLEFLLEVQQLKQKIVIEWPEGGKLNISRRCDLSDMNFAVTKKTDWFEMSANLQVNEQQVINMSDLLEQTAETNFVQLSDGEFIALTDKLKQRLLELKALSFAVGKEKLKIHPLNVHQIDDILADDCAFKPGKAWQAQLKKIRQAEQHQPTVPSTLQAELRPYQADGFKWLSRLAVWGVGACLADDMGLGKTVQALTVILERASAGPALVVAPSSVCMNWVAEALRFTPALNPMLFADGDRETTLKNLKPFDLLVTSYGLLSSEEQRFAELNWETVVLDEAQYIKNAKAKRTKAAFSLQSKFKLITTGTPVENHLLELWTLFSFINPGLLGNKTEFMEKFVNSIEKAQDKQAALALKKLIQPFLLRRIKTDVLSELPPKTEINLAIELSAQERAFYEALRRNSVEIISGMKEEQQGAVHLRVLAELTKLRQACCHPSLITKKSTINSSKLDKFAEIVEELIENRHKALVFSQFVGYLHILRDFCDANGIKYQYLDGSTPMKERQRRVEAFQAGAGDLFLISLKAGGTGLNLTAADYVIHMDPWWNPAVEDQASDRTHRIGQQRPVTIYRFVSQGTVEEKIIALHQQKRELANSLLDGADMAAKISLDELVNLLN